MFEKIKNFILDTLFPVFCLLCGKYGEWLCKECFEKIKILTSQICPYCEKNITETGKVCLPCREHFRKNNRLVPLDSLVVATEYEKNSAQIIHTYKYNFAGELSIPLGKISVKALIKNGALLPDLIIPVPLHKRRERWRGFNQAKLLADYISRNLSPGYIIPVESNSLARKKYTSPQMQIKSYHERKENIKNAFENNNLGILENKKILLVDDVATTGSTLFECAKTLKENGASSISGIVIARQKIKSGN